MKTLVYSENTELSMQLLGKALQLSGAGVSAIAVGSAQADALAECGAKVWRPTLNVPRRLLAQ